jgi:hypothetical protein
VKLVVVAAICAQQILSPGDKAPVPRATLSVATLADQPPAITEVAGAMSYRNEILAQMPVDMDEYGFGRRPDTGVSIDPYNTASPIAAEDARVMAVRTDTVAVLSGIIDEKFEKTRPQIGAYCAEQLQSFRLSELCGEFIVWHAGAMIRAVREPGLPLPGATIAPPAAVPRP